MGRFFQENKFVRMCWYLFDSLYTTECDDDDDDDVDDAHIEDDDDDFEGDDDYEEDDDHKSLFTKAQGFH